MNGGDIDTNKTVKNAVLKFNRKERNRSGTSLFEKLKQSREAVGLPLAQARSDSNLTTSDAGNGSKTRTSSKMATTSSARNERGVDKGKTPATRSQPDDRPSTRDFRPPTSSSVVNVSPWQEMISPVPSESVTEQGQSEPYSQTAKSVHTPEPETPERSETKDSWQKSKTLEECNLHVLSNEIGCDVTLLVGESQEVMNTHSYMLMLRSAKFADMLEDQKQFDNKLFSIPDVEPETMQLLLRYFYTDDIELIFETAKDLIPAAYVYGSSSLKTDCFRTLLSEMSSDNVCPTMELAHKFEQPDAYKSCLNFIYINAVDVLKTKNFKELCRDCVEDIVKSDNLNANELAVFDGLILWSNGECSRGRIEHNDRGRRQALGNLLYYVRFATMDVLEFIQKISNKEILSREEKILLFQYFHGEKHALPPHFNMKKRHKYKIKDNLKNEANPKATTVIKLPKIPSPKKALVSHNAEEDTSKEASLVKRVIRFQGLDKDWQTTGPDAIGFRVSQPIVLYGAQIFGPHAEQGPHDVEITVYDDYKDVIRRDTKAIFTGDNPQVYDVTLTNPVRVPEGRIFVIQTSLQGKAEYHGTNGLDTVELDSVTFQFFNSNRSVNGTDVKIGQIPTILFSIAEDS